MTVPVAGGAPDFAVIEGLPITVGRDPESGLRILHPTVSRRHATLARAGETISVADHDSRFGTFVNGIRIRSVSAQKGDRIQFGSAPAYRVHRNGLALDAAAHGMELAAAGLTIARGGRVLVKNVGVRIEPNQFVGILGPSGAGKSTILNCLASYLPPHAGKIIFDDHLDQRENIDVFRSLIGHVPQDDLIYLPLTVQENLEFAAQLRLGVSGSPDDIKAGVTRVLEQVGLTEHANDPAHELSGGQRKRLSVAIELLKRPRLLLLDEPTSGLDPATEAHLMEQLRYLASRGTTVICTTHLMENIRLFDSVIALGMVECKGRVAYAGSPNELLSTFDCRGFADLYERLAEGKFTPISRDGIVSRPSAAPAVSPWSHAPTLKITSDLETSKASSSFNVEIKRLVTAAAESSEGNQTKTLLSRAIVLLRRDRMLIGAIVLQPLILGLLNCLAQHAASQSPPVLFFTIIIAIWLGLNNSARDLVRDRKLYVRERLAGLNPGVYLASKWLVHTAIGAMQLGILLAVLGLFSQTFEESLAKDLKSLSCFRLFCILMTVYTGALGAGLAVSALVRTEETAVAFLPLLIMPQLLISAVGTNRVQEVFYLDQPGDTAFRPLVIKLKGEKSLSRGAALADGVSLACYSRPAILLVKPPGIVHERGEWILIVDGIHLCILVLGTWTFTILAFRRQEDRWTQLVGIG